MARQPAVFVIDDDAAVRASLRWLLESADLQVETYSGAGEFLAHFDPERPGCVVLDVHMPKMSGLDLQAELVARRATIPLILMTGYPTTAIAVDAMRHGAFDFVEKPFNDEQILSRIRAAIAADRRTRQTHALNQSIQRQMMQLTSRERQVLDLVVAAQTNEAIAKVLGVKKRTIGFYRTRLYRKLGVRSVDELVRWRESVPRGTSQPC
jgi:two-component system, LuxR family, response regulator FixJ